MSSQLKRISVWVTTSLMVVCFSTSAYAGGTSSTPKAALGITVPTERVSLCVDESISLYGTEEKWLCGYECTSSIREFTDPDGRDPVVVAGRPGAFNGSFKGHNFVVNDLRNVPGFDRAAQRAASSYLEKKYGKGKSDITPETPVVRVDSRAEAVDAYNGSGEGGTKAFIGHSEIRVDDDGTWIAIGIRPGYGGAKDDVVGGAAVGTLVANTGGSNCVAVVCSGESMTTSKPGETPRTHALGPPAKKGVTQLRPTWEWSSPEAEKRAQQAGYVVKPEQDLKIKSLTVE